MKQIVIEAVSQHAMRPPYDQAPQGGDWIVNPEGDLVVRVIGEDLARPEAFLFALHELVEAYLCLAQGVSQRAVDAFDGLFAAERDQHGEDDEPGDDPRAPYRAQHRAAMLLEHLMASFLGMTDYGTVR